METVTVNGIQWKVESVDFVDVDGNRLLGGPEAKIVYDLFDRGHYEQATALLRSLTWPEPFRATNLEPTDRRPS